MGNEDKSIIESALRLINENNKFVLSNISKTYQTKTNFYKLSTSDPELPPEIIRTDEESRKFDRPTPDGDDPLSIPSLDDLLDSEKDPIKERKESPKPYKRSTNRGFLKFLEDATLRAQAIAIFESDLDQVAENEKLDRKMFKKMTQQEKDDFMLVRGGKSLAQIMEMSPEDRSEYLGVEHRRSPKMPNSRILNTNLGRNK